MRESPSTRRIGSIDGVTGWPGTRSDETTFEGTGHQTRREAERGHGWWPASLLTFEGAPMNLCTKSGPSLQHATAFPLEFKADHSGFIAGYGSVFGVTDRSGEKVERGAFAKSLAERAAIKMLWQHRQDTPIGRWLKVQEDTKGLYVEGQLNMKTTAGRDAYEHLAAGDVDSMSIGYREVKARYEGNVRLLEELTLYEVSVVTFPANPAAAVETVKSVTLNSKSDLVDLLRQAGLAKAAAARVAAGGWPAIAGDADIPNTNGLADIIDRATAELRRL